MTRKHVFNFRFLSGLSKRNYYFLQLSIIVLFIFSSGYTIYSYYISGKQPTVVATLTEETVSQPKPVSGAAPPTGGFGLGIEKPIADGPSRHSNVSSRYSTPKPYKSPLALSKTDSEEKQELKEPVSKKVVEKPIAIDQKQESNFEKYLQLAANISSILFPLMGMTLSLMWKRSQLKELRADKNKLRSRIIDNEDIPFTF